MTKKIIASAVLLGGKSSRMGKNKAFLKIKDLSFLDRTIKVLDSIFPKIYLSVDSIDKYEEYEKKTILVEDKIKEIGPLGGIFSILQEMKEQSLFFVACDMPFLHKELILQMISIFKRNKYNAVVPVLDGYIQPLHSIFDKNILKYFPNFLKEKKYSIKEFLKTIDVFYLSLKSNYFNKNIFKNINTKKEFRALKNDKKNKNFKSK